MFHFLSAGPTEADCNDSYFVNYQCNTKVYINPKTMWRGTTTRQCSSAPAKTTRNSLYFHHIKQMMKHQAVIPTMTCLCPVPVPNRKGDMLQEHCLYPFQGRERISHYLSRIQLSTQNVLESSLMVQKKNQCYKSNLSNVTGSRTGFEHL